MSSDTLIIFGSQYGYTEQYAHWVAEELEKNPATGTSKLVPAANLTASDFENIGNVIIGASDYGGFLTGANIVQKFEQQLADKKRYFFSVSFSGLEGMPADKLDAIVTKNFGSLTEGAQIFHFRGGLDHKRLSLKHKTVMMGIRAGIAAMPHKNEANRQMLESFETGVADYSSRESIAPLVSAVAVESA